MSTDINIVKNILGLESNLDSNFTYDKELINFKIESLSGVKIYNKNNLCDEIEELVNKDLTNISKCIVKNMLTEITFETMFRKNLDFSIAFNKDDVLVLYKNKIIQIEDLAYIHKDILETKKEYLPPITELYIDCIITIIDKLIKKDLSVCFHCTHFPTMWWKLFELKCIKHNSKAPYVLSKYDFLQDIISGANYKKVVIPILEEKTDMMEVVSDDDISDILKQIDAYENKEEDDIKYDNNNECGNDDVHRMEVMSYLNDNEVMFFLNKTETIDKFSKELTHTNIASNISTLLKLVSETDNKIIKFYFVNIIFKQIIKHDNILEHTSFANVVNKKVDELSQDLYIIQSTGLTLGNDITNTLTAIKKLAMKKVPKS